MAVFDRFYLGWAAEAAHGTSTITGAGDTAYKLGSIADNCFLPSIEWDIEEVSPDWGERKTSLLVKRLQHLHTENCAFLPHNGVPFYWLMGDSATAGTVHTLDAASQASGIIPELPSICFHAERVDSTATLTDWRTGWAGCRTSGARIMCGDEYPILTVDMSWLCTSQAKKAFSLTSKPSDVSGTHTTPLHYLWAGSTHKYDSTTIEGVMGWEITVNNGSIAAPPDYGATAPSAVYQGPHQRVELRVRYNPRVETFQDDLETSAVPSKDWEFEFIRHTTNDKLKFTCTTCATKEHPVPVPTDAGDFVVDAVFAVTSLTITVTDQIAAGVYND